MQVLANNLAERRCGSPTLGRDTVTFGPFLRSQRGELSLDRREPLIVRMKIVKTPVRFLRVQQNRGQRVSVFTPQLAKEVTAFPDLGQSSWVVVYSSEMASQFCRNVVEIVRRTLHPISFGREGRLTRQLVTNGAEQRQHSVIAAQPVHGADESVTVRLTMSQQFLFSGQFVILTRPGDRRLSELVDLICKQINFSSPSSFVAAKRFAVGKQCSTLAA